MVELVLHLQHMDVGPQRHLPHAVAMEVELVFLKILEVLAHRQKLLQRLRAISTLQPRCVRPCAGPSKLQNLS